MSSEDSSLKLEMKGITKLFPGVVALDKVDLVVRKGTVHVIAGENGAGKSTLMKVLSGEHRIDGGEIRFDDKKVEIDSIKTSLELGIAMIYQELSPVLDMTIAENIFLGREPVRKVHSFVDYKEMYSNTSKILESLGLKYNPKTKMRDLSIASLQLIEIAKAISRGASLIIMDEPTSAISDQEVEMLFEQIFDLKKKGVTIIYITHKMDEIFRIADDITVIRDGQHIETAPSSSFDESKVIARMVGRTISNIFPKENNNIGETVFEVKNLTSKGIFNDISFDVKKGEIVGLAGLVGAGRTEVVRAIFGLDKYDSGEIILNGESLKIKMPQDAIKHGIAMVPEDRKEIGLVLCRSVMENATLANLNQFSKRSIVKRKLEVEAVDEMIEMLRIKTHSKNQLVLNLSGGNQQKVVLAKWLMGDLKVLILDEPTRGIDVRAKSEIHRIMSELANKGVAIIMISSELPEILGMSDRVFVLQHGSLTAEVPRERATQERIMKYATSKQEELLA